MAWNISEKEGVVIVEMNSNKANLHNPAFFADFHHAFDQVDKDFPSLPLIFTASGAIFSAGIDFSYCFDLFEKGNQDEVHDWFKNYSGMMLRLFKSPRLTVAAINGHTFAGGAILALCCDFRIGVGGSARYSINEVPVGVPMPSVYTEIIRCRLGNPAASESILSGEVYHAESALKLGIIKKIVAADQLITEAVKQALVITPDCYTAYAHSKKALQAPFLQFIQEHSPRIEIETVKKICAPDSKRAQRTAFNRLQSSKK